MLLLVRLLICVAVALPVFAFQSPSRHEVEITASDGVKLKATYYVGMKPAPAVLLLHMCDSNRMGWDPVGRQLSAVGINALALDYRGFGESGGERFDSDPLKQQEIRDKLWPGDIDAAFTYLGSQPGVD